MTVYIKLTYIERDPNHGTSKILKLYYIMDVIPRTVMFQYYTIEFAVI